MTHAIRSVTQETVRTGRYAMLGADPAIARRVWFVLHGYGQLAERFLRPFDGIVPDDTCIVAPEGLNRFYREMPKSDGSHLQKVGATWMTREAREDDIADTMRWLDTVHHAVIGTRAVEAVGVLGFSQGVATATRWIAQGAVRPSAFVVWAGGLATDVPQQALRDRLRQVEVTFIAGDHDPFLSEESRPHAMAALRSIQSAAREVTFHGEHTLDPFTLGPLLAGLQRKA
jgi:predicted esterase